jgi:hypothetical protein
LCEKNARRPLSLHTNAITRNAVQEAEVEYPRTMAVLEFSISYYKHISYRRIKDVVQRLFPDWHTHCIMDRVRS